jgi:uncharacterized protein
MFKALSVFLAFIVMGSCASVPKDSKLTPEEAHSRECFNFIIENKTKEFINKIEQCKNVRNPMGLTPMMLAIAKENIDLVEAMIAAKVDVNELDRAGMTALVFAANKNNVRIVQLLRRAGARVEVVNNNLSGLMMAARNSSLELIQVMNPTAQEINIPAEDGWTAIYFAINRKDAGILRYLLDHGACTSVKDTYQQTPLQYAEELEWKEGAKILKRKNKC